jgi:20S proteasome alpha/beta subunit
MSDLSAKDRAKYSNDDVIVLVMTDEEGFPVLTKEELEFRRW